MTYGRAQIRQFRVVLKPVFADFGWMQHTFFPSSWRLSSIEKMPQMLRLLDKLYQR
jgi:hypothetical protein